MRVGDSYSIFAGENTSAQRNQELSGKENKQGKRGAIFAGNLIRNQDPILMKKQEAQKKAYKLVSDTWSGDRSVDDDLDKRREHIRSLSEDIRENKKVIQDIHGKIASLQESFGITDDSQEQKDLELLQKRNNNIAMSTEEKKRLAEIDQNGMTEYQTTALELGKQLKEYQTKLTENENLMKMENTIISEVRKERLKSAPMVEASQEAEDIKEAASQEVIGLLMEEAKEHIEEEQAEREEKAEEIKEKKEEEEELLEKSKEDKEEVLDEIPTQQLLTAENMVDNVQQEIKNIVSKMNLVAEDIKGAMVDQTV